MKIRRIVMCKWQEAVNDPSCNWMIWFTKESIDWSGSLDPTYFQFELFARVIIARWSIAVLKDGEESEEREVAQTWKDRICVPVRFLLRGSATCLRTYIRALDTSAPIDRESVNRVPPVMFAERDVRNISLPINARERERGTCERISRENGFPSRQITAVDWKYTIESSKITGTHTKCVSKIERYLSHERGWKVYPVGFYSIVYLTFFNRVSDRVIRTLCGNLTGERVSRWRSDCIGGPKAELEVKGDQRSGSRDRSIVVWDSVKRQREFRDHGGQSLRSIEL